MAKGHRSQIKRERNANKDTRPSAKLSYARVSVQKACFVLDAIRGKDVTTALGILTYNPRYASSLIKKLLESAIANAENNNGMNAENLYIAEAYANKGPTMKRIRPTVRGSVMNPNDHPHGGGEGKTGIGRPGPCTPWGKPALGLKTRKKKKASNKLIVRRRDGKAIK